jgi:hypothetical protein
MIKNESQLTYGLVVSPSEVNAFDSPQRSAVEPSPFIVICKGPSTVSDLLRVDVVIFVITRNSMCSTAYQETVFLALAETAHKRQELLRLDDVKVPLGFCGIAALPDARFSPVAVDWRPLPGQADQ